jgi:hypothetical protein
MKRKIVLTIELQDNVEADTIIETLNAEVIMYVLEEDR